MNNDVSIFMHDLAAINISANGTAHRHQQRLETSRHLNVYKPVIPNHRQAQHDNALGLHYMIQKENG